MINQHLQSNPEAGVFGAVDEMDAWGAAGWIIDTSKLSTPHTINAFLNNRLIGTTQTNYFRADISAIITKDVHCGFRIDWNKSELAEAVSSLDEHAPIQIKFMLDGDARLLSSHYSPTRDELIQWATKSKVFGNLDLFDLNLTAIGWATEIGETEKAQVEIFLDGRPVAVEKAKLPRPDLAVLKPAQILSGYKISVPREAVKSISFNIEARANGYPLPGSPIAVDYFSSLRIGTPYLSKGHLTAELFNWPGEMLEAELLINGEFATHINFESQKNQNHTSLKASWELPKNIADGQPRVYSVIIRHNKMVVRSDSVALSHPQYFLSIDSASTSHISGWAFRAENDHPLKLGLFKDLEKVSVTTGNIHRGDVQTIFTSAPDKCGFRFDLSTASREHSTEYTIKDLSNDIALCAVSITSPYEALTELATAVAALGSNAHSATLNTTLAAIISAQTNEPTHKLRKFPSDVAVDNSAIDVIIPVYGGAAETVECIESVLAARNSRTSRVIIINDCSPDAQINAYLNAVDARRIPNLFIFHRKINGGFSEAVNMGFIIAGRRDVILLNADTVVQDRWLDKIGAAADTDPRIGTITPLSNNAEICTIPYMCKSLHVSDTDFAKRIDSIAHSINPGVLTELPVAIGFCMYIRRTCLDQVGLFDAAKWGRGYGEEVDFCLKASAQGWRHVMAGDTFVVHRGSVSFGDEKLERIKESAKKIAVLYPFYDKVIQRFLAADPGRPVRRKLNTAIISELLPQPRVLHVTHAFGGGTGQYVSDMAELNKAEGFSAVVMEFQASGACSIKFDLSKCSQDGFFQDEHVEEYYRSEVGDIKADLQQLKITQVHIHGPFGIPLELLNWITDEHPYVVTIHDYSWACPQVTLSQHSGKYCGEPTVDQCNNCVKLFAPNEGLQHFVDSTQGEVQAYRDAFKAVIANARTVITGAQDVRNRMERLGFQANYKVVPHAAPESSPLHQNIVLPADAFSTGTVKIALIGGISDIKGYYVLKACAKEALSRNLPIEFIVFGTTMNDARLKALSNITVTGKYTSADLESLITEFRPHVAFFPNMWPETFSYTLSHAFRFGLWPVASDLGAPAERIRESGFGTIYNPGLSIEALVDLLLDEGFKRAPIIGPRPTNEPYYPKHYGRYIESTSNELKPAEKLQKTKKRIVKG